MKIIVKNLTAYGRGFTHTGLLVAVIFFCLAQTPSLIPRSWLWQGMLSGISVAIGYGAGVLGAWIFRKLGFNVTWSERTRQIFGWIITGLAVVSVPTFLALGAHWKAKLSLLLEMPEAPPGHVLYVLGMTVLLAVLLVQAARGCRWITRKVGAFLSKLLPVPAARLIGVALVSTLVVMTLNGAVLGGVLGALRTSSAAIDQGTVDGVVAPTVPERSGSPASLVEWDSLGLQGRSFVGGGPSHAELTAFAAQTESLAETPVKEPIRVYAGLRSADTQQEVADRVVEELDRTGAWDREILAVANATGTGWIDPSFSMSLEYMHAGNTAIASMQYSFLPSWVSFISDQATPPAAGKILFDTVYRKWASLPEETRPYLLVFGLSLGSYGGQGAFSGLQDMAERTDGALWMGTPNFSEPWRSLTDNRDRGSLEYSPIVDNGKQARWSTTPNSTAGLLEFSDPWSGQRTVYVQHASDAVVWWSTDLLFNQPDWIREPPGPDRLSTMFYIPVVTFWQVSFDMFVAGEVPIGHGHNYHLEYAGSLAQLGAPEKWGASDTEALEALMRTIKSQS